MSRGLVVLAAIAAIGVPAWLLHDSGHPMASTPQPRAGQPIGGKARPPMAAALARPLFSEPVDPATAATVDEHDVPLDPDAPPRVVGVAGRLPGDAVALVRTEGGRTKSLRVGDSFGDWRLVALASDAALFERGGKRTRVALPPAQ